TGQAAARRPAAVLLGVHHPPGGTGQGAVHPQGFGHPGAAWRARAAGRRLGPARPAAAAQPGRVRVRSPAGGGLLRAHPAASRLRERALPHRDHPHPRAGGHLPGQVRGARRGPGRGPRPRRVAGDARAHAAPVLALAPRQPGEPVLLRRVRRLPQAAALEGVLVWLRVACRYFRLRGALRASPRDPRGAPPRGEGAGEAGLSTDWSRPPTLQGRHVRLEPLQAAHAAGLRTAAADGELWTLWYTNVPAPAEVDAWIDRALEKQARGEPLAFTERDAGGRIVGSTRCYELLPETPRLCIGYTWYARSVQRTGVNTEAKLLLLGHAFDTLRCASVGFHTSAANATSRAAIARLGAT